MYLRIVKASPQAGQVEELARRWQGFIGARLKQQPGFRHAYFGGGQAGSTTAAVSLWDARPDEAATAAMMTEFRQQIADIAGDTPPVIEEYEVLAEV